jgi:NAD-dependent deacetylase
MREAATLEQIATWLREARSAVAFTGAGISTESGIPDFRSPGGVWATSQPVYFDEFLRDPQARHEYWRQKAITHREFSTSEPNAGHSVLAKWQAEGLLSAIITQNIDGLHQQAGAHDVIELHGTARQVSCLECHARYDADEFVAKFLEEDVVPRCPNCGSELLKHATISFGQQLDPDVLSAAVRASQQADLFFALGSSLVVEPAASLPRQAKARGGRLVIVNRDATPQDELADAVVRDSIGAALTALDQLISAQDR